jgi:hypothetical protein
MGLLLKIALFGVAVYALWKTLARWKGLYDRFVGPAPQEPPRQPPAQAPPESAAQAPRPAPPAISDASACVRCGTYVAPGAAKCERPDCPQPA